MLVLVLVIVLVVTNLATLGVLAYRHAVPDDGPAPDAAAAGALDRSPRPPAVLGATRRVISIEILNPIELAGTKGRIAGIAGSLVPGLTRRIVYDQTLKILKQQLVDQHVVADVRLHTLRPVEPGTPPPAARVDRAPRAETVRAPRPEDVRSDDLRTDDSRTDDLRTDDSRPRRSRDAKARRSTPTKSTSPESPSGRSDAVVVPVAEPADEAAPEGTVAYIDDIQRVNLDAIGDPDPPQQA